MAISLLDDRDALLDSVLRSGLSRRRLLRATAGLTGTALAAPLLAACGGDDDDDEPTLAAATATSGPQPTATTGQTGAATPTAAATQGAAATPTTVPPTPTPVISEAGEGGSLIVGRANDSDSLDPQRTIAGASWFIFSNIFDSLVTTNMDLEFEGVVAESWEISDDGLQYTWKIREGVLFHDGSTLTVEDVKYTFDRATNAENPSQAASFINAYDHAEIIDDTTVQFFMKEPSAPFMKNIAVEYFGILPQAVVEEKGDDFGKEPVGSGPWMLDEWIEGEQIRLVPFADYKNPRSYVDNKGAPRADELLVRVIPESQTLLVAFETGEVNIIELPASEYPNFKDNDDYQIFLPGGGTNIIYFEFATEAGEGETYEPVFKAPFDDVNVRKAVAHAMNVDEIIESVLNGLADRNYGFMPTGLFAYDPAIEEFGYKYDPDLANQLLDEAGWTMGGDGVREKDGAKLEIEFWAWVDPTYEKVAQVLQNQLGEVGIKLNLSVLEVGTMLARLPENAHNANIMGVGWPEADILHVMAFDIGWGLGHYRKPDYIKLLKDARTTLDQDERKRLYFEAQKIALADVAAVPMWTDLQPVAARKSVKNFYLGPESVFVYVDANVEE